MNRVTNYNAAAALGERYRDVASGYAGVAVGVWFALGMTPQVLLIRQRADGVVEERWLPVERVEAAPDLAPGEYA